MSFTAKAHGYSDGHDYSDTDDNGIIARARAEETSAIHRVTEIDTTQPIETTTQCASSAPWWSMDAPLSAPSEWDEREIQGDTRSDTVARRVLWCSIVMTTTTPTKCPTCGKVMRMRYPGNDPENGPARMACHRSYCQGKAHDREEREYYYSLDMEEAHEQAMAEEADAKRWDDMDAEFDAKYPS